MVENYTMTSTDRAYNGHQQPQAKDDVDVAVQLLLDVTELEGAVAEVQRQLGVHTSEDDHTSSPAAVLDHTASQEHVVHINRRKDHVLMLAISVGVRDGGVQMMNLNKGLLSDIKSASERVQVLAGILTDEITVQVGQAVGFICLLEHTSQCRGRLLLQTSTLFKEGRKYFVSPSKPAVST